VQALHAGARPAKKGERDAFLPARRCMGDAAGRAGGTALVARRRIADNNKRSRNYNLTSIKRDTQYSFIEDDT
jgi:hypothetical protein